MEFIPYKLNEVITNSFYQIPKELFTSPYYYYLSNVSKLLYGLLLDRLSLSMKNNWVDENGNIYLILSRNEVGKKLHISDKTVTKLFKELSEAKLIYDVRTGFKKNNIIYVGKVNYF